MAAAAVGHLDPAELVAKLKAAKQLVVIGGTYAHYKNGDKYRLVDVVMSEMTQEPQVVYEKLEESSPLQGMRFVRPARHWSHSVVWNDVVQPHFKLLVVAGGDPQQDRNFQDASCLRQSLLRFQDKGIPLSHEFVLDNADLPALQAEFQRCKAVAMTRSRRSS